VPALLFASGRKIQKFKELLMFNLVVQIELIPHYTKIFDIIAKKAIYF